MTVLYFSLALFVIGVIGSISTIPVDARFGELKGKQWVFAILAFQFLPILLFSALTY